MRDAIRCVVALAVVLSIGWGLVEHAQAQTGVSDNRVSLPEGPGSLEGIGDDASVNPNMGLMRYSVPIKVPSGFAGMTPSVGLSYSSGSGSGELGMGWSMEVGSIERRTVLGLPEYDRDDVFVADGGVELVETERGADASVYRARFEGGFVKYTWHSPGAGAEGHWTAQWPDGRVGYFGADADGNAVESARLRGPDGVFRYLLTEIRDVFGHRTTYHYRYVGSVPLLEQIGYVFTDGETPTYRIDFGYEERDDFLSDCKGGFNELLQHRLASIHVFARGVRIRRYALQYQDPGDSGGLSRLASVREFGLDDTEYPERFEFEYSQTLGCQGCEEGYLVELGALTGANIRSGNATLIDINGDGLPDVVDSSEPGQPHRFFINTLDPNGTQSLVLRTSALSASSSFSIAAPSVQTLDVNGDGFADLLNAVTGEALINTGQGDWSSTANLSGNANLPDFAEDFAFGDDTELKYVRFLDYDNDKRIDVMRASADSTSIYRNLGDSGFEQAPNTENIGAGFESGRLDLADMNGDGLMDVVQIRPGQLRHRLNLGRGRWAAWATIEDMPFEDAVLDRVELEDLNGDGLADVVWVMSGAVHYALSRNGASYREAVVLSEIGGAAIPERNTDTSVLFADMNGNGSDDIVWIDPNGETTFLELFPTRPNLITRISNGLGRVSEVTYGASVAHRVRDAALGRPWAHVLPYPMTVVESLDVYETLNAVHEVTEYTYSDGFYDGDEKQFRGYGRVVRRLVAPSAQEEGVVTSVFEVGAEDVYRHNLLVSETTASGDGPLQEEHHAYGDCALDEVPEPSVLEGLGRRPVRYLCKTATQMIHQEGAPQSAWPTVETRHTYDGYGNVIRATMDGVVSVGGQGCGPCQDGPEVFGVPCGAQCLGDEKTTEVDFVPPSQTSGVWMLNKPWRVRVWGREGDSRVQETRMYYDGAPFEGLVEGSLTQGKVTRVTERVHDDSDEVIQRVRNAHDVHGNVIDAIDPNGDPARMTHRRQVMYDVDGLRVTRVEVLLDDAELGAYRLRRDVGYEPAFDRVAFATAWMRVVDGSVLSTDRTTRYAYDGFGRLVATAKPGDTLESPTETVAYFLSDPVSRVVLNRRAQQGGALDLETVRCMDGRGRMVQERTRIEPDLYQVTGFRRFNQRGDTDEVFQPYTSTTANCDAQPPEGTRSTRYTYDAINRPLDVVSPDASIYGTPSVQRTVYEPLRVSVYDAEDTDPTSPHHNTPVVQHHDGMGRLVTIERPLEAGGAAVAWRVRYDGLGHVAGYTDPEGNTKAQTFDLLGRVVEVDDPNAGVTRMVYDAAGNLTRREDARGVVARVSYDGANRPVARWDDADREATLERWRYDVPRDCPQDVCTHTANALVEADFPTGSDRFGYDARGRRRVAQRAFGGAVFTTRWTYDNADRVVAIDHPGELSETRRYDDASRLVAIDGVLDTIDYDARGLSARITRTNGVETVFTYDARMRMASSNTRNADTAIQGFAYTRDRVSNLLNINALAENGVASAALTHDAWYRVIDAQLGPDSAQPEGLALAYDALDNVLDLTSSRGAASPAHRGVYTLDDTRPNAVAQTRERMLDYDAAGHVITRGDTALAWDHLGRLVRAERDGAQVGRFDYDTDHARAIKREGASVVHYVSSAYAIRDGVGVLSTRIGQQRVALTRSTDVAARMLSDLAPTREGVDDTRIAEPDGAIHASDAWIAEAAQRGIIQLDAEPTPSNTRQLLRASARRLLVEEAPSATTHLHHDHLGNITASTGSDGQLSGRAHFYPYGLPRGEVWGDLGSYGFTGQETDASTGLVHFKRRNLDPETGRWLSPDPMFAVYRNEHHGKHGEATTAYAYVGNRFMDRVDPLGLSKRKLFSIATIVKEVLKRSGKGFNVRRSTEYGDAFISFKKNSYDSKVSKGIESVVSGGLARRRQYFGGLAQTSGMIQVNANIERNRFPTFGVSVGGAARIGLGPVRGAMAIKTDFRSLYFSVNRGVGGVSDFAMGNDYDGLNFSGEISGDCWSKEYKIKDLIEDLF